MNGRREVDTVTAEAELNRFLDRPAGKVAEERVGLRAFDQAQEEVA